MRIFIGTHENCGIISGLQEGLTQAGCEVTTAVKSRDKYFPDKVYTIDLSAKKKINKFLQGPIASWVERLIDTLKYKHIFHSLPEFDLYIYCWDTLLPNLQDLEILKKAGRKVFFMFIGSDVRYAPAFNQQFPDTQIPWGDYYLTEDFEKKILFIRTIEKYADAIFSAPDQAGLQVRPFYHAHLPLDIENIPFNFPDRAIPRIVHAPSHRNLKGTSYIIEALENCKQERLKFEFRIIENKLNSELQAELQQADIVVDQIHLHGPGMFGIEAMASGCALATKYLRGYDSFEPPVMYIDHSSVLKENLKQLIINQDLRRELAYKGRKFAETHNLPRNIGERLISIYNREQKFDFHPTFFHQFKSDASQKLTNHVALLNKEIIEKYTR